MSETLVCTVKGWVRTCYYVCTQLHSLLADTMEIFAVHPARFYYGGPTYMLPIVNLALHHISHTISSH